MKFNISENKLERWTKQEEGCYIAAGAVPSAKITTPTVHQGLAPKKKITLTAVPLPSRVR